MPNYLKIPDGALGSQLQAILNTCFLPGNTQLRIRLYASLIVPSNTDTLSTYSPFEATFPGYAYQPYSSSSWTTPVVAASVATSALPLTTFLCSSTPGTPQTIYGYFVGTFDSSETLAFAQLFDTPLTITVVGNYVQFTPQFQYNSRY
jgi:hypothetical protein